MDKLVAQRAKIARSRAMRKTLTPHEARLWAWLKTLRRDYHFRRQAPLLGYYPDFLCLSRRLVIELDGGGHMEDAQAGHDRIRDEVMRRNGFRTLRIWNGDLDADFDGVQPDDPPSARRGHTPTLARFARLSLPTRGREE